MTVARLKAELTEEEYRYWCAYILWLEEQRGDA